MPEPITYCIDTSALIELKWLYPNKVFPSLWEKFTELVRQGRLIAPHEVSKEIEKIDDTLLEWVKWHKSIFKEQIQEQVEVVKDILQKYPTLVDPAKETPEADPFVIALAIVEQRAMQQSFFGGKCIVITRKQRTGSGGGRPRIPDVCSVYGVECVHGPTALAELFKQENWRF